MLVCDFRMTQVSAIGFLHTVSKSTPCRHDQCQSLFQCTSPVTHQPSQLRPPNAQYTISCEFLINKYKFSLSKRRPHLFSSKNQELTLSESSKVSRNLFLHLARAIGTGNLEAPHAGSHTSEWTYAITTRGVLERWCVIGGGPLAARHLLVVKHLLAVEVTFLLNDGLGLFIVVLITVTHVPLGKKVILDPDNLAESLCYRNLATNVEPRMAQQSLVQHVLDHAQSGTNVDVLNMKGVLAAETDMHHADLVEVLPKLHLAGIAAELVEVGAEEHFAVQDLRGVLVGHIIEGTREGRAAGHESTGRNVILKEFMVDDIDNGRNESLDVFGTGNEGFNVS